MHYKQYINLKIKNSKKTSATADVAKLYQINLNTFSETQLRYLAKGY